MSESNCTATRFRCDPIEFEAGRKICHAHTPRTFDLTSYEDLLYARLAGVVIFKNGVCATEAFAPGLVRTAAR